MLLTFHGYFKSGQFVPDTQAQIPEGRKTIVTVLDEIVDENSAEVLRANLWGKIISDIENCDEVLLGEPERIRFKTPEEITAL